MEINDYSYMASIQGINAVTPFTQTTPKVESTASGDTVSISEEAMELFGKMQQEMQGAGAVASESTESGAGNTPTASEGQEASTDDNAHSQGNEDGGNASGGGAGGGGGGGGASSDSSSDESDTDALEAQISSLQMQIAAAQMAAESSGDTSQVSALKGQLASLEAELSALA